MKIISKYNDLTVHGTKSGRYYVTKTGKDAELFESMKFDEAIQWAIDHAEEELCNGEQG